MNSLVWQAYIDRNYSKSANKYFLPPQKNPAKTIYLSSSSVVSSLTRIKLVKQS